MVFLCAFLGLHLTQATDWDIRSTKTGTGSYRQGKRSDQLNEVTVILEKNGPAEIRIRGTRNETFKGTWRDARNGRRDLTITDGPDSATGRGRVYLDNPRKDFTSINFSGRSRRGNYSVSFSQGNQRNQGSQPQVGAFSGVGVTRRSGSGTLNIAGDVSKLQYAEVRLDRGGRGEIYAHGTMNVRLYIRWTQRNNYGVNFDITGAYRDPKASGNGSLTLDENQTGFTDLRCSGRVNDKPFSITFRSNRP